MTAGHRGKIFKIAFQSVTVAMVVIGILVIIILK